MRTPRWPLTAAIVLGLTLTACGGDAEEAGPTPEPSAPVAQTQSPPASGSAAPTAAEPPGEVPDPCQALTKEEASKVVGHKIDTVEVSELAGSKLCAYTPAEAAKGPSITTQATPVTGDLDSMAKFITGQFDDVKISEIDVAGASDARLITGKLSESNAVDIVVVKDEVLYQLLVADSKIKVKELTKIAKQGAEAMAN